MKKWWLLFVAAGIGLGVFSALLFIGPEMKDQPNIRAYQACVPPPPAGVVPVETVAGIPSSAEAAALQNPLPATPENIARGRTYYGYYCLPCHGEAADGNGPVGQSFLPHPANLLSCRGCHGEAAAGNAPAVEGFPPSSELHPAREPNLTDDRLLRVIFRLPGHRPAIEPPAQTSVLEYTVLPQHRRYLLLYIRRLMSGRETPGS